MPFTATAPHPPPPPPPPPGGMQVRSRLQTNPSPPVVTPIGPAGAFMVVLLIYNGAPFMDHWAYWVPSHTDPEVGVVIEANGDVRNGFTIEIKRSQELNTTTGDIPTKKIPLQWVDGENFNKSEMLNNGVYKIDNIPVCKFEASVIKVKAPEKTLNTVDENVSYSTMLGIPRVVVLSSPRLLWMSE